MIPDFLTGSKRVFHGKRFDVRTVQLAGADGRSVKKEIVVHPGAVVILPLLDEKTIVMIRNERVAVGQTLLELPAGTLEPGEDPQACAGREVIEETGYRAAEIDPLLEFFTSPGICTERMFGFVARGLEQVGQDLDETERIIPKPVAMDEAIRLVRDGQIRDGKTIAMLLYYRMFQAQAGGDGKSRI